MNNGFVKTCSEPNKPGGGGLRPPYKSNAAYCFADGAVVPELGPLGAEGEFAVHVRLHARDAPQPGSLGQRAVQPAARVLLWDEERVG